MRVHVFDGTPDEFKQVAHLFVSSGTSGPAKTELGPLQEANQEISSLNPTLIELALNRIPLSRKQSKVWRAIVGAYPDWITAEELAKITGIERPQLAGVWGALGRRLANTPGWPEDKWPLDEERDDDGMRRYRAHEVLVQLVKGGRIKLK